MDGEVVYLAAGAAWQVLHHAARVARHEGASAATPVGTAHGAAQRYELDLVNAGPVAPL